MLFWPQLRTNKINIKYLFIIHYFSKNGDPKHTVNYSGKVPKEVQIYEWILELCKFKIQLGSFWYHLDWIQWLMQTRPYLALPSTEIEPSPTGVRYCRSAKSKLNDEGSVFNFVKMPKYLFYGVVRINCSSPSSYTTPTWNPNLHQSHMLLL